MKYYLPIMEQGLTVEELLISASSAKFTAELLEPSRDFNEDVGAWYEERKEEGALPYTIGQPLHEGDILYLPTSFLGFFKIVINQFVTFR